MAARHRRGENYFAALFTLIGRDRHRYGGYIIHLGVVIMGLGVIGNTSFQDVTQQTMGVGERLSLGPYMLEHNRLSEAESVDGRLMLIADATVYDDQGNEVTTIRPRRDIFMRWDSQMQAMTPSTNMSIAGTHSTLQGDFYAIIFVEGSDVVYRVYWNPLISFVWLGGIMLTVGTFVALWPKRQPSPVSRRVAAGAGSGHEHAGAGR